MIKIILKAAAYTIAGAVVETLIKEKIKNLADEASELKGDKE